MARRLEGKRIALTGPRKAQELGKLVENMGGIPLFRPAQGTVFLDDLELRNGLVDWISHPPDWAVFTTGVGIEALFDIAEDMGIAEAFWENLQKTPIAARGYKTVNALKKRKLEPVVRDDDGSTDGLIRSFSAYSLLGKNVMIQLHGDPAPKLVDWLKEQGAEPRQILPYKHTPPPDEALELLLQDILQGHVDAVTFTSAPQVKFLMEFARRQGQAEELNEALSGPVTAVAVGKITAQGLVEAGIPRIVAPREERMGSMMVELSRYYAGEAEAFYELKKMG
ncbi:uroporphyrinogen-III synthase [Paenibacillus shirakamiensis]|uniref:Uroporphyrinogen-III synthase n=1 Tax=Paenibacillus shirakamiensis TaxID=1265935 RepID=A0ABS4JJK0_9BACL|nr:uroporphyrinogen-III synthase [Paenibacillus shirakamiensis]MBP2001875.1 uroporphyrinogen-III synthase [Paenibacillus shirakamiensis]